MFGLDISAKELFMLMVTGLCIGFGSAIGNYLAQRSFIRHLEKINMSKINGNDKKQTK